MANELCDECHKERPNVGPWEGGRRLCGPCKFRIALKPNVASKARAPDLCGRCEAPIGKAKAALCDFAPYAGMHLHATCIAALMADTTEEEP